MPFIPETPTGDYIVQGIPLGRGESPGIRQELREFRKNDDLWNLYLLGLWQFQLVDKKYQLSYSQIAGIHGLPYAEWPVGDELLKKLRQQETGFCTHTSILFLSWHRPYLALFEGILQKAMLYVAQQYTKEEGQDRYVKAAESFRMPYWDWALPDVPAFPSEATSSKTVQVIMPESLRKEYTDLKKAGETVEIPNPLYAFKFGADVVSDLKLSIKDGQSVPDGLKKHHTTTRYLMEGSSKPSELSPEEQQKLLLSSITPYSQEINQQLPVEGNLRERVLYLLQAYQKFSYVSHNQWDPKRVPDTNSARPKVDGLGFGSIEDIHNTLHVLTGGWGNYDGHMSHVPIAAFDPIFWLHHTNIDRLVSIWQGLHDDPNEPDTWVTTKRADAASGGGTWITRRGDPEGLETPLAPFYKEAGVFWKSSDIRETTTFGYAYPETKSWTFNSQEDYRKDIRKQLLALYPSGSLGDMILAAKAGNGKPETILRKRAKKLAQVEAVEQPSTALTMLSLVRTASPAAPAAKPSFASVLPPVQVPNIEIPDGRSLTALVKNDTYLEWLFNIKAEKHALDGEYLVHVFLGRVPQEESTIRYAISPYHVGTFSPLGQPEGTGCGKCQRDQASRTEVTGQIPLTIALAERYFAGALDSFSEEDVIRYLKKDLHWEVVDREGRRLQSHRDAVDGLLVGVTSNEVTLPQSQYDLPRYSPDITIYPEITTKQEGHLGRAEGTGITASNIFGSSTV
ncbi:common central domain of tyrosinase-domain-containing protein [Xylariaceae sp. AK1471]|nr:common central domain of tyrosinase-domain-containing protein [Xylariaceae sp. AK1471]